MPSLSKIRTAPRDREAISEIVWVDNVVMFAFMPVMVIESGPRAM